MSEDQIWTPESYKKSERETKVNRIINLVSELNELRAALYFPDITGEAYAKIRATEMEYPGYGTPIDDLLKRFKEEGMKVIMGKHPESGNVYVIPAHSNDIENDSISPRQLRLDASSDPLLLELVSALETLTDENDIV